MNEYRTPYGVYTWQTPERGQRTEMATDSGVKNTDELLEEAVLRVGTLETDRGTFISERWFAEVFPLVWQFTGTITRIKFVGAEEIPTGFRYLQLEQLNGQLLGNMKAIAGLAERWGALDEFDVLIERVREYEEAISNALRGDFSPLETLVKADPLKF